MIKRELIDVVAHKSGKTPAEVATVINTMLDVIRYELSAGNEVQIYGFGTFNIKHRAERQVRNPQTKELMKQAACKRPHFTPSRAFRLAVKLL